MPKTTTVKPRRTTTQGRVLAGIYANGASVSSPRVITAAKREGGRVAIVAVDQRGRSLILHVTKRQAHVLSELLEREALKGHIPWSNRPTSAWLDEAVTEAEDRCEPSAG